MYDIKRWVQSDSFDMKEEVLSAREDEYLEIIALDEFVERDVMEGKSDAKMAAEIERLVNCHDVGAAGLLLSLQDKRFAYYF